MADPAHILDAGRPGDRETLPRATEVGGDLLGPLERRVEGPGPPDRHVRIGRGRAPVVVELELLFDGDVQDAVVRGVHVGRAERRAFGTRAVVAVDVDDQRVVELPHVLDGLDHPTDLMVGIGGIGGEDLRLSREELLLVGRERLPFRQLCGPRGELRICGNDAQLLLIGEDLLAHVVPAHVELALELVDPLLRRLVRRVTSSGHVVDEERLVGRRGLERLHVLDGLIGHVRGEVVVGLVDPREDLVVISEQVGRPLVGLAAQEAVEIVEAHSRRPLVEGSRDAVLEARRVVVLAEPRRGIAVTLQDRTDGRILGADERVIARIARRELRDHTEAHRMVVAAGDERRARRRAERGGIELRVTESRLGDPVQGRRRDDATERAADAVALVVGHDEQDVGRTLGRHDARRPPGRRVHGAFFDHATEFRRRRRELIPLERGGGAGGTQHARDLLRRGRCDGQRGGE